MNVPNRAALIAKTHKILKKHYRPVQPHSDRSVLEHLLYACCLENSPYQDADDVFARLLESYFDWNEIRVTTTRELASAMAALADSADSAKRLKATLQSVFETHYSFDLDFYKKQNLGKAVKEFEKLKGVTPFAISYVTQNSLSGHSIPVSEGALQALYAVGVVSEAEAKKGLTPGLERAVTKNKGVEFASLLHQLGVEFRKSPFSKNVRAVMLEIAPDAKDRFPKRPSKKSKPAAAESAKKTAAKSASKGAAKGASKADPKRKRKKTASNAGTGSKKAVPTSKALKKKKPR